MCVCVCVCVCVNFELKEDTKWDQSKRSGFGYVVEVGREGFSGTWYVKKGHDSPKGRERIVWLEYCVCGAE